MSSLIPKNITEHHYVIRAQSQNEVKPLSISAEERHRKAMFEIGNTRVGKDGRTFVAIDTNGEYQSCFVSQYSNIIDKNIEPKIKGVCLELHKKNYLTFGSCQGHEDSKMRWVGIVFNTVEQKNEFIKNIDELSLKIYWYDNIINSVERPRKKEPWYSDSCKLHIVWDQSHLENASIEEKREFPYTESDLTKFWNLQMGRNYNRYESIIMCIGKRMLYNNFFEQLWKNFTYDELKINKITAELEEKIKTIPAYCG
jgi:hypothetical protein